MTATPYTPPELGDTFTNEATGVEYTYDGQRWVISGSAASQPNYDDRYVNSDGDEMTGQLLVNDVVIAHPGRTGNEVVTFAQLEEIEQEIEDLIPSIERGIWEYSTAETEAGLPFGQYKIATLVNETFCKLEHSNCLADCGAAGETEGDCLTNCNIQLDACLDPEGDRLNKKEYNNRFDYANALYLSKQDVNGTGHTWEDVGPDEYIEIRNTDGSGFGLYKISQFTDEGIKVRLNVVMVSSSGTPNENAKIKIFRMAEADPNDYVMKAGDTMKGELKIVNDDSGGALYLYGNTGTGTVFYVRARGNADKTIFRVTGDGRVQAGHTDKTAFMAELDHDLVTKKYLREKHIPGSPYVFTEKQKGSLSAGEMMAEEGTGVFHCSITDANGVQHISNSEKTDYSGCWYVLRIYDKNGKKVWAHTGTKVYAIGTSGYIAWAKTSWLLQGILNPGETYWVADGLFLS